MVLFTVSALGAAFFLGLGNGAVFKLVPQYFPDQVGTVTGPVGAAGGLGGFFPPLVLGVLKDQGARSLRASCSWLCLHWLAWRWTGSSYWAARPWL